jgi:hypothetical protein
MANSDSASNSALNATSPVLNGQLQKKLSTNSTYGLRVRIAHIILSFLLLTSSAVAENLRETTDQRLRTDRCAKQISLPWCEDEATPWPYACTGGSFISGVLEEQPVHLGSARMHGPTVTNLRGTPSMMPWVNEQQDRRMQTPYSASCGVEGVKMVGGAVSCKDPSCTTPSSWNNCRCLDNAQCDHSPLPWIATEVTQCRVRLSSPPPKIIRRFKFGHFLTEFFGQL